MKKRILRDMLLLSLVTIVFSSVLICAAIYRHAFRDMKQQVRDKASYISTLIADGSSVYMQRLKRVDSEKRITVIHQDGTVLYDNTTDASFMENHSDRSEVKAALTTGFGEALRRSDTLGRQTYYYAIRLQDNTLLRVAFTSDTVFAVFLSIIPTIILIACIVFLIALMMALKQSRQLVEPINGINLENPSVNPVYDELSPLLTRIRQLRQHIDQQVAEARKNQEQFASITANMMEGLILLNEKGHVLSVNDRARELLGVGGENTRKHILSLNRSTELQKIVQKVLSGQSVKENLSQEGRIISVLASPVQKDGQIGGAMLILRDVTESQPLEDFRKEFSANVSHELKTPLTIISGFAELLQNNLVKPEDVPAFSEKIHNEAKRLINLVDDIIVISRLDENTTDIPLEKVDLLAAARDVGQRLQAVAQQKGVTLEVAGEHVLISAVPRLLDELIQNLCDNAIQYNRENGKVTVRVSLKGNSAVLQIQDTGIGIPQEHQSRVFERFYRVDKSHSRQTGGTGLGLSIVKHVALYHRAAVRLESAVGVGTTITVLFPV